MSKFLIAIALTAVLACGGKKQPAPSEPSNTSSTEPANGSASQGGGEPMTMSPADCTAKGGQVKGDIGDGKVACAAGELNLGRVRQGIEGAICCGPATATP
jgi:hypothetical protein